MKRFVEIVQSKTSFSEKSCSGYLSSHKVRRKVLGNLFRFCTHDGPKKKASKQKIKKLSLPIWIWIYLAVSMYLT